MSNQYQIRHNYHGDMTIQSGWVTNLDSYPSRCGPLGKRLPGSDTLEERAAVESDGSTYLGGSGRNMILSGIPLYTTPDLEVHDHNGVWAHGYPNYWVMRQWRLVPAVPGPSMVDQDNVVVATSAPISPPNLPFNYTFTSTAHGTALMGVAWTATSVAEYTYPGVRPKCYLTTALECMQLGELTSTDAANYASAADPLLTIGITYEGVASMSYAGVVIAIREYGDNNNAEGTYYNTPAGLLWNPRPPEYDQGHKPEINPFGILTLVYSWAATSDLDTMTLFSGGKVGATYGLTAPYLTQSGDNTAASGSETVTVNLAGAWLAGLLDAPAEILCHADWFYPTARGPATLTVNYTKPGFVQQVLTIRPANVAPGSTTLVAALRVGLDGTVTQNYDPWICTVGTEWVPTPAGAIFAKLRTNSAGYLTAPPSLHYEASLPTPVTTAGDTIRPYFLGVSDGKYIEQIHTGDIQLSTL